MKCAADEKKEATVAASTSSSTASVAVAPLSNFTATFLQQQQETVVTGGHVPLNMEQVNYIAAPSSLPMPYQQSSVAPSVVQSCQTTSSYQDAVAIKASSSESSTTTVAETYEWLITAGVPFSAFDPIALECSQRSSRSSTDKNNDLYECAAEIKSLFASAPPTAATPSSVQSSSPSTGSVVPTTTTSLTSSTSPLNSSALTSELDSFLNTTYTAPGVSHSPAAAVASNPVPFYELDTELVGAPLGLLGM